MWLHKSFNAAQCYKPNSGHANTYFTLRPLTTVIHMSLLCDSSTLLSRLLFVHFIVQFYIPLRYVWQEENKIRPWHSSILSLLYFLSVSSVVSYLLFLFIFRSRYFFCCIWRSSSYRAVNSLRLCWKNQPVNIVCRSQWPRGLRRGSSAARLLGSLVRIPPGAWMSVSCECCVLSGRGLCDGLVPRPEESYRLWCV
jgi:hypothetical protein